MPVSDPLLSAAVQDGQKAAAAAIDKVMCRYQAGYPAHLVVVESGLVLDGLEALLDRPATAGYPGQLGGFGVGGAIADVVGNLVGVGDRPAAGSRTLSHR